MEKFNVNKKTKMGAQKDLNYSCFVPSIFVIRSFCTQPSFVSFSCSRFAGRYTEKYIVIIDMYRIVQYIINESKRNN